MKITVMVACLVFLITVANNPLNWKGLNKQLKEKESHFLATGYYHPEKDQESEEKEIYVFATGYYHPEKDQDLYATGSYEEDLELNGEGITASGKRARKGHVAVDPSFIPLGTRLFSREYGILKAEDTGGRIKGNRIDIFTGDGKNGLIAALKVRGWIKVKILD
jgi:3D (Asp-Asp-Asp) domain-containing protein